MKTTLPKLSDLTPEQKLKLIAEACGWTRIHKNEFGNIGGEPKGKIWQGLPAFTTSLDACAEMEMSIPKHDRGSYTMNLRRIIQRDCNSAEYYVDGCDRAQLIADFWFYHATAAQRADSFLITTGKATM